MWYILAIMLKRLAIFLLLLAAATLAPVSAQTSKPSAGTPSPDATSAVTQTPVDTTPVSQPAPHITSVTSPVVVDAWPWHDKILWGATLILVFIAYFALYLANTALTAIRMQTGYIEEAARAALESSKAAQDCANAAILQTQSFINAERPWILITVEPSLKTENGFMVTATNRGRSPAKLILASDRIGVVADETQLPATPEYAKEESSNLPLPLILLPGESAGVRPFGRDDVKWVCKTPESMRRIEFWQEKIFLYGKIVYRDLISTADQDTHETDWCCWYIHGEKKSGMVIAGPPNYNQHS
jgi:hypothetical protein